MAIRKSSNSGIPFGNNSGRPANNIGQPYFNGETARLELYTGNGWQNIVQETPGVASITGTYNESSGSGTIIISGTNFVNGAIASVIGTNGVEIQATTTTYNSLVQLTAVFTGLNAAHEPFDIKVTNPSNLFGLIPDALYINQSPVWQYSSGSLGSFNEGTSVSIAALATDPENSPLTFAIASGSLPSGVSLNASTGAISGTAPSLSENVTYSFTVSVTDAVNTTISRLFNITVNSIVTWSTSAGSLGTLSYAGSQGYSYQLSAIGLENTLSYSVVSGSLPSGLSLSSAGIISGSASEVQSQTTSSFTVRASDGAAYADRSFSITINPAISSTTYSSSGTYSITIPSGITAAEVTLLGAGGGGSTGNGEWAYGGGGGSYLKAVYPVSPGSYSLTVGAFGPGQTSCNNAVYATAGKGGNTTFGTLVASGGSGGTQRSEGSYSAGGGIGLANVTTGATSIIKNLIGGNGNGGGELLSSGGSNGLKNIENDSTYGQGAAGTPNTTPGTHATGNGNGGGGGASCQNSAHRGGGNGSSGYAIIKY
jgi:hypothetical protein